MGIMTGMFIIIILLLIFSFVLYLTTVQELNEVRTSLNRLKEFENLSLTEYGIFKLGDKVHSGFFPLGDYKLVEITYKGESGIWFKGKRGNSFYEGPYYFFRKGKN